MSNRQTSEPDEYLTAKEIEQIEADPNLTVDDVVTYRRSQ